MNIDDYERTAKARQVRLEKRTVEDVLQALEDLVGNELDLDRGFGGAPAETSVSALLPRTAELWEEDIPVLRDIVVPPPLAESDGTRAPDPRQMRDVVRRAVATFNSRLAEGQRLNGAAVELLEHLLFEEWVRAHGTASPPRSPS